MTLEELEVAQYGRLGSLSPMKAVFIGKCGKVKATPGSSRLTWLFMMYLLALMGMKYLRSTNA